MQTGSCDGHYWYQAQEWESEGLVESQRRIGEFIKLLLVELFHGFLFFGMWRRVLPRRLEGCNSSAVNNPVFVKYFVGVSSITHWGSPAIVAEHLF